MVSQLIHKVLGADDIQIVFANAITFSGRNGGRQAHHSSSHKMIVKLETQG